MSFGPISSGAISSLPTAATAAATPAPNGWFGQLSKAPLALPAAVVTAVILCPQPITQAVAATPTLDWQAPLAIAPQPVRVAQGFSYVPFDTVQPSTAIYTGWQSQLSTAPRAASAAYAQSQLITPPAAQPSLAWQQPLATAVSVSVPPYSAASFVVPPFTVPQGWQSQLSVAPKLLAPARDPNLPLPVYPVVVTPDNTVTLDKWQRPLATAPPIVTPPQGYSYVPFNTVQPASQVASYGWLSALSVAPQALQPVRGGASFVVPQFAVPSGWQSQLSTAPAQAKTAQGFVAAPYAVQPVVSLAWQQPLGIAPPRSNAAQGFAIVPLDTAQTQPVTTPYVWLAPLSIAPPVVGTPPGYSYVPFDTVQVVPPVVVEPEPPVSNGGSGVDRRISSRAWRSSTRPAVYVSALDRVRRDLEQQAKDQFVEHIEPARVLKPEFVEPIEMALSRLDQSVLFEEIEREARKKAQALELKRRQDDDAIALLLLMI